MRHTFPIDLCIERSALHEAWITLRQLLNAQDWILLLPSLSTTNSHYLLLLYPLHTAEHRVPGCSIRPLFFTQDDIIVFIISAGQVQR